MRKEMSKKGAMELSVNTIVIVVIGITLLVLGLVFVRDIFEKLSDLGGRAFEEAEKELSQIQGGDAKINFPSSITIKKGKSSTTNLRVCNTDGKLTPGTGPTADIDVSYSNIYGGLSITGEGLSIVGSTTLPNNGVGVVGTAGMSLPSKTCLVFPILIYSQPTTVVDYAYQPFLSIEVTGGDGTVYDSIGVTLSVE